MSEHEEPLPRGWTSYKSPAFKPTPEQVAIVRWIAEQDAVLKERLRKERRAKR